MIHDATPLADGTTLEAEVCIVGAGAAGITIARELGGAGVRTCLLESGGMDAAPAPWVPGDVEPGGVPHAPLGDARAQGFGGTTSRWTGWCRPLDAIDFEARPWVARSGWPFDAAHLAPYYARAQPLVGLDGRGYATREWERAGARPLPTDGCRLASTMFRCSPPTHFGREHRDEIERSSAVRVYLHASVVGLERDEGGRLVAAVRARTRAGATVRVRARHVVLAAGGIENARLLLDSSDGRRAPIGNAHDLVGRHFMEHPHWWGGALEPPADVTPLALYLVPHTARPAEVREAVGALALGERVQREEGLLNGAVRLVERAAWQTHPSYDLPAPAAARALVAAVRARGPAGRVLRELAGAAAGPVDIAAVMARRAAAGRRPPMRIAIRAFIEQAPDPESRVVLSPRRDALGRRLPLLRWRLGEAERRTARRLLALVRDALDGAGLGRAELRPIHDGARWDPSLVGGAHHMGTTRMHASPREGVVDEHGRVHEIGNLHVAGSSVFPTGGHANPTLTIVALSLRLADRLRAVLGA